MRSGKVKGFSFPMFNNQAKLVQKRRNNIVTTKKKQIDFFKRFFLRNKESTIYKRQEENRNFWIFNMFFKNIEKW